MSGGIARQRQYRMPESAQRIPAPVPPYAGQSPAVFASDRPSGQARRPSRAGALSALIHLLIILLIAMPVASHVGDVIERAQGAGGPGPAGGGGGGRRGTGGIRERVRYVQVAPPEPTPTPKAVVPPPVVPPKPQPVIPPPQVVKAPDPIPEPKVAEAKIEVPKAEAIAPTPGTGGGTGRDGSTWQTGLAPAAASGSGIGTGAARESGPEPVAERRPTIRRRRRSCSFRRFQCRTRSAGFHLVAEYDVDATGEGGGLQLHRARATADTTGVSRKC